MTDFNQNWNVLTHFSKDPKYEISSSYGICRQTVTDMTQFFCVCLEMVITWILTRMYTILPHKTRLIF